MGRGGDHACSFRVFPGCIRLSGASRRRVLGRVREAEKGLSAGEVGEDEAGVSVRSVMAHAAHADTVAFRRSLVQNEAHGYGDKRARTG